MEISRRNFVAAVISAAAGYHLPKALGAYQPGWKPPIGVWLPHELHAFIHERLGSIDLRIGGETRYFATDIDTYNPLTRAVSPASQILMGCYVRYQSLAHLPADMNQAEHAAWKMLGTFSVIGPDELGPGNGLTWYSMKFSEVACESDSDDVEVVSGDQVVVCEFDDIYVSGDPVAMERFRS
jgi:hypothetical protein